MARGCDEHEAEDVVQEMFASLVRVDRLEELDALPEADQAAVLGRRLKCALMNHWRDRQRLCRQAKRTVSLTEMEEHEWHPSTHGTPATELDRRWALQRVSEALTRLRSECGSRWQVLEQAFFSSSRDEAASNRDRVTLCRARERLRSLLRPQELREALLQAA
jgi:DNA-directed RNA polymerase specialized sigma24 family protein